MSRESKENYLLPGRGFKQWSRELLLDDTNTSALFENAESPAIA